MMFKNLQLRCSSLPYNKNMFCLDQLKNSYRVPRLIKPDYTDYLLKKMEAHVNKYGLQDCIAQLQSEQAQTFLSEDIRAVNRLYYSYDGHMQLLGKYCPTDSISARVALQNKLEIEYFNSLAFDTSEMLSTAYQTAYKAIKIGLSFHDGYVLGMKSYTVLPAMADAIDGDEMIKIAGLVCGALTALTNAALEFN